MNSGKVAQLEIMGYSNGLGICHSYIIEICDYLFFLHIGPFTVKAVDSLS